MNSNHNHLSDHPKITVLAVVGPTGSGKTALCLELARQLSAEIVSCDSRAVYRHLDIGTAKPSIREQALIRHHLIDVAEPDEIYTAATYKEQARSAIGQIVSRGSFPIVCGGTGFYARALLEGLSIPTVAPDPELRGRLKRLAVDQGDGQLMSMLKELDPVTAGRLHINDRFRIIRALEVSILTGKPFSSEAGRVSPPYRTIWVGLTAENRSNLHVSLGRRLEEQLEAGLINEVTNLLGRFGPCQTIMNTVNYREFVEYLTGQCDLAQAKANCIQHNRQLARRQLIWFRGNSEITWFPVDRMQPEELQEQVLAHVCTRLRSGSP